VTDPRLLVFDLDGTLVPTMEDYADKAASLMEAAFGTPFIQARADYFRTSGLPFEQQLRLLYPDHGDTDAVADHFEAWKDEYLLGIALLPETAALLREWQAGGRRIAISSNNLDHYVGRMAAGWPVDFALGYRPGEGYGKGEPHFRLLETETGLSRRDMLFVGDSPNDARIAEACGVPFRALLTPAFTATDFQAAVPDVTMIGSLVELGLQLA